jgi:hypothetical protein
MSAATNSRQASTPTSGGLVRRRWAKAPRLALSLGLAGSLSIALYNLLPRGLSISTDIVGYPIHKNFNIERYFERYYLLVYVFPVLALALYHWLSRGGPRRLEQPPTGVGAMPAQPLATTGRVLSQLARGAVVGAMLGVTLAVLLRSEGSAFWTTVGLSLLGYAGVLFGAAFLVSWMRQAAVPFLDIVAGTNAILAALTPCTLWLVSTCTRVVVVADGSEWPYPWMPVWLAGLAVAGVLAWTVVDLRRLARPEAWRNIEARRLGLVVLPIALFLVMAQLSGLIGELDLFHNGESLVGGDLLARGVFPWRDFLFIHGMLQDVVVPWAGAQVFGNSVWGATSGFTMFAGPLWWTLHYCLLAYLLRGNPWLLSAAFLVSLGRFLPIVHYRFLVLPVVLLSFALVLARSSRWRAGVFGLVLVGVNILVPEMAFAIVALGVVLVGFELYHRLPGAPLVVSYRRTIATFIAGLAGTAAWMAFLAANGAAGAFVSYYLTFAPGHKWAGGVPISGESLENLGFVAAMVIPVAACLLFFLYFVASLRARRVLSIADWVMAGLAIFVSLYYTKFLSRADMHVYQSLAPALPLLLYVIHKGQTLVAEATRRPFAVHWCGAVLVALSLAWVHPVALAASVSGIGGNYLRVSPKPSDDSRLGWSNGETGAAETARRELKLFLDTYLTADDTLFDFTNQPALYHYLLGLKPSTKYYHVSMAIRSATQAELIRGLSAARPKLIAFQSTTGGLRGWDSIPTEVRHYTISHYLLEHYGPFARLHGQLFYARKDLSLQPTSALADGVVEYFVGNAGYMSADACDWGYAPSYFSDPARESRMSEAATDVPFTSARVRSRLLQLDGWAADIDGQAPATEILVFSDDALVARTRPNRDRPDAARYLRNSRETRFGFALSSMLSAGVSAPPLVDADLHVFAVSSDGSASELSLVAHSACLPAILSRRSPVLVADAAPMPIRPEPAIGFVDVCELGPVREFAAYSFALPEGVTGRTFGALRITAPRFERVGYSLTDSPPPGTVGILSAPWNEELVSFRTPRRRATTLEVRLDNCPQWYGFTGRSLYLYAEPFMELTSIALVGTRAASP